MLHITWKLLEINEDSIIIEQENWYKQKVEFEKSRVKNKEGLEKILKLDISSDLVVGVLVFVVAYKKDNTCKGFAKFVLNWDIVL